MSGDASQLYEKSRTQREDPQISFRHFLYCPLGDVIPWTMYRTPVLVNELSVQHHVL